MSAEAETLSGRDSSRAMKRRSPHEQAKATYERRKSRQRRGWPEEALDNPPWVKPGKLEGFDLQWARQMLGYVLPLMIAGQEMERRIDQRLRLLEGAMRQRGGLR